MRRYSIKTLLAVLFLSLISMNSSHADWIEGLKAYNKLDFKTAIKEWLPLAEQGDANSQYNVGKMYLVLKNYEQAAKWHSKAAEQDNVMSQYVLGTMYLAGLGVSEDMSKGKYLMKKAYDSNRFPLDKKKKAEILRFINMLEEVEKLGFKSLSACEEAERCKNNLTPLLP